MSKMRKFAAVLLCLALVTALFGGCGGDDPAPAANGGGQAPAEGAGEQAGDGEDGGATGEGSATSMAGKKIVYLAPSKDILYWQWVEAGVYDACEEMGVEVVTYDAQNSTAQQASNLETALTQGVDGIVISPVSSPSITPLLELCEEEGIPITIAAIGPDEGVTSYTCNVTADDYTSGYENGIFLCRRVKELGGGTIGVLSLPLDRTNAQNKMAGLEKACAEEGIEICQVLQTSDLTVNLATQQANDLLTTHADMKGIYGMYEQAGLAAVIAVESAGLEGQVSIVSSDGSPESIAYVREGKIDGIVVQEAVGQGLVAAQQLFRAIQGLEVEAKDIPLPEPLVTTDNIDDPEIQEILRLVYPASAGAY